MDIRKKNIDYKEYTNGEITVVWQAHKCVHSGNCVERLPEVYNPQERPWVKPENATTRQLQDQIEACPSGALTYRMNAELNHSEANAPKAVVHNTESSATEVRAKKNGPLLVSGLVNVTCPDGRVESKDTVTAFCRCGASSNMPYCNGTHSKIGFEEKAAE